MKITIWGARGSIPTPPAPQTVREKIIAALEGAAGIDLSDPLAVRSYVDSLPALAAGIAGGNTACVELQAAGQQIIIDAGTGLRQLGSKLMSGPCGRGEGRIHLFFSHTHWDHIQGFPFFLPAFVPGNRIYIYSTHNVEPVLIDQMRPATFPISFEDMRARATIEFIPLQEEHSIAVGEVSVIPFALPHPGRSYAYRFEHNGSVFVYASDAEYKYLDDEHLQPYVRFFAGADALIFDAQYTLRESLVKEDWGHSSALVGAEIARRAGVKRLLLFHHDPNSSDQDLLSILAQANAYCEACEPQPACEIMLATEGLTIELETLGAFSLRWLAAETAILMLREDFNQRMVPEVLAEVAEIVAAGRLPRLVIDLSGIAALSVGCLRALIDLQRRWQQRPLALAGVPAQAWQVIELAQCGDLFHAYPTVQAALEALAARETLRLPGHLLKERYRIEALLGEGALGQIFRATDVRLERPVMIKALSPALSQSVTQRLLDEARPMARLQAPNIVMLFDCDEDQGLAYLVMEYAGSQTLRDVIGSERQPAPLFIAMGILRGLEYAHSRGVVHGNLRPENVLIADEVKLTDFALRRLSQEHDAAEAPGISGVPYYLAPEQIAFGPVTVQADLYALGIMLYELFTGRRPFEGDAHEVLRQHLSAQPEPPRRLHPGLSRSLEFLILKLLSKDPEQRYASATHVRRVLSSLGTDAPQGQPPAGGASANRQRRLFGRDVQLQRLLRLWRRSRQGEGQVVLIAGESGIGKTTLAEELAAQAQEALVAVGHCGELEGDAPYQPFVEVGREYLAHVPPGRLLADLGVSASSLAALLPELHALIPDLASPLALEPEQERQRLMHSFKQLIAGAATSRSRLIILDDLHWADPASLELLHYLARHVAAMPVLIVGIYRDVELDGNHPLRELVRGLSRTQVYHHMVLSRLDLADVRQLLAGLLQTEVPEEWTAAIYERTGGNPFYIEEVVRTLVDEGAVAFRDGGWRFAPAVEVRLPQSVRDIVLRRVARLRQPAQDLLRRAAVLGQQFSFVDLLAVADHGEEQLLDLLDEMFGGDLIRELDGGMTLAFSHPEIQQVIYEDLRDLRRRSLHRRVGLALEQQHAQQLEAIAGQLALHFTSAGDTERGFTYSLRAARHARSLQAYQTALHWYTQALESYSESVAHDGACVDLYEGLGSMYFLQARYAEAIAAYTAMQKAAEPVADLEAQARMWNGMNAVYSRQGDYRAALKAARQAAELAEASGSQLELANALYGQGWSLMKMGDAEQATALGRQLQTLSTALEARDMLGKSLNLLGSVMSNQGKFERSAGYYQQALAIYREIGDRRGVAMILNNLGEDFRVRGEYQPASEHYEEALAIASETGNLILQHTLLHNIAAVQVGLGEYHSAEARLRRIIHAAEREGSADLSEAYRLLSEVCLGLGRPEEALEAALQALVWGCFSAEQEHIGGAWRIVGMVLAQSDRILAPDELALDPSCLPARRDVQRPIRAPDCFSQSLHIFTRTGMAAERARVLRSWALYELRYGDRARSTQLWQEAAELFAGLGMEQELRRMAALQPQPSLPPAAPQP